MSLLTRRKRKRFTVPLGAASTFRRKEPSTAARVFAVASLLIASAAQVALVLRTLKPVAAKEVTVPKFDKPESDAKILSFEDGEAEEAAQSRRTTPKRETA